MHRNPQSFLSTLLGAVLAGLAVGGCGPGNVPAPGDDDPSRRLVEESLRQQEAAEKEHLIGFDPRGLPIYGVDENGQPVYKRDK